MSNDRERRLTVSDGAGNTYIVLATQTHRAQKLTTQPALEWQFYIEALNLILVQDGERYVSIDDPNQVFTVVANAAVGKSAVSVGLPPA